VTSINLFPTSGPLVTVYDFILWGENKSTDELDKQDIDLYSKDVYRTQDPNAKAIASTAQPKIYDATNGLVTDGGRVAMEVVSGNYFLFDKERIAGKPNVSLFASFNSDDTRGGLWGLEGGYRGPYFHSTSTSSYVSNFGSPSTFSDSDEKTITNATTAYNEVIDGTKNTFSLINGDATSWTVPTTQNITLFNFIDAASSSDTLTGKYHEFVFFTTDVASDREAIEADINSAFGSYSLANLRRQERLLNQFPGAAAAYSVRQVNANYLGPIMRIDNGYTEIDIYPLPNGDLDTATIIQHAKVNTFTEAAGVSVWYDQSGNGNDASQAVRTNQPLICDNGVVFYENGKPAVNFDVTDRLTNSMSVINQPITVFNTVSVENYGSVNYAFDSGYTTGDRVFIGMNTSNDWRYFAGSTINTSTPVAFEQTVLTGLFDGGNSELFLNGLSVSTGNAGSNGLSDLVIGNKNDGTNFSIYGNMQELILYPSDQSSNRHKIESNINTYFDIYPQTPTDLLLDKNPDAAAAYSLRKLRRTYAGPAVKVRRASDNVEADVYFDRNNEVSLESRVANVSETTTGSSQGSATFTLAVPTLGEFLGDADYVSGGATDGFVVVWYDQAKSNNAEQLAAANQPKIYDATTGVVLDSNGDATLDGDATTLTFLTLSSSIVLQSNWAMLFAGDFLNGDRLAGSGSYGIVAQVGSSTVTRSDISSQIVTTFTLASTGSRLLGFYMNGSNYIGTSNGTQDTQTSNSASYTIDRLFYYGNVSLWTKGSIKEVVIYDSDQSSNRKKIETDINNHYSIYQNTPEGGLLNQYGDAAAAYSLRALDFSYSGPLVRVRRDSDHVEADVYADENGVFSERSFIRNVSETSTGVTVGAPNDSRAFRFGEFAYGANCFVVEWKDQSGSDNHASQDVAADQPKIYDATTGVVTENGKPAIDTMTDLQGMPFTSVIQATNQFIALVGYINNQNIWLGSSDYFGFINNLTTAVRANNISEVYTSPTVSNQTIITYTRNGSESQLYQEGSSLGTSTALSTQVSDYDGIGTYSRAGAANFKMQEIVIYDSDQSNFRTAIEDNINKFYKIY